MLKVVACGDVSGGFQQTIDIASYPSETQYVDIGTNAKFEVPALTPYNSGKKDCKIILVEAYSTSSSNTHSMFVTPDAYVDIGANYLTPLDQNAHGDLEFFLQVTSAVSQKLITTQKYYLKVGCPPESLTTSSSFVAQDKYLYGSDYIYTYSFPTIDASKTYCSITSAEIISLELIDNQGAVTLVLNPENYLNFDSTCEQPPCSQVNLKPNYELIQQGKICQERDTGGKRYSAQSGYSFDECFSKCKLDSTCIGFAQGSSSSSYVTRCDLYNNLDCTFTNQYPFDYYQINNHLEVGQKLQFKIKTYISGSLINFHESDLITIEAICGPNSVVITPGTNKEISYYTALKTASSPTMVSLNFNSFKCSGPATCCDKLTYYVLKSSSAIMTATQVGTGGCSIQEMADYADYQDPTNKFEYYLGQTALSPFTVESCGSLCQNTSWCLKFVISDDFTQCFLHQGSCTPDGNAGLTHYEKASSGFSDCSIDYVTSGDGTRWNRTQKKEKMSNDEISSWISGNTVEQCLDLCQNSKSQCQSISVKRASLDCKLLNHENSWEIVKNLENDFYEKCAFGPTYQSEIVISTLGKISPFSENGLTLTDGGSTMSFQVDDDSSIGQFEYYIAASNEESTGIQKIGYTNFAISPKIQWNVECGEFSNNIEIDQYQAGFPKDQIVQIKDRDGPTQFNLPTFKDTFNNLDKCPITYVSASKISSSLNYGISLNVQGYQNDVRENSSSELYWENSECGGATSFLNVKGNERNNDLQSCQWGCYFGHSKCRSYLYVTEDTNDQTHVITPILIKTHQHCVELAEYRISEDNNHPTLESCHSLCLITATCVQFELGKDYPYKCELFKSTRCSYDNEFNYDVYQPSLILCVYYENHCSFKKAPSGTLVHPIGNRVIQGGGFIFQLFEKKEKSIDVPTALAHYDNSVQGYQYFTIRIFTKGGGIFYLSDKNTFRVGCHQQQILPEPLPVVKWIELGDESQRIYQIIHPTFTSSFCQWVQNTVQKVYIEKAAWEERLFHKNWDDDLTGVEPDLVRNPTSIEYNLNNFAAGFTDNIRIEYSGKFYVQTAGEFIFYIRSDDGSRISIDGIIVAEMWAIQGVKTIQGTIYLTEGEHSFFAEYFQGGWNYEFSLEYEGPGVTRQIMKDESPYTQVSPESYVELSECGQVYNSLQLCEKLQYIGPIDKPFYIIVYLQYTIHDKYTQIDKQIPFQALRIHISCSEQTNLVISSITSPITFNKLQNTIISGFTSDADAAKYLVTFPSFTCTVPACCPSLTYKISDSPTPPLESNFILRQSKSKCNNENSGLNNFSTTNIEECERNCDANPNCNQFVVKYNLQKVEHCNLYSNCNDIVSDNNKGFFDRRFKVMFLNSVCGGGGGIETAQTGSFTFIECQRLCQIDLTKCVNFLHESGGQSCKLYSEACTEQSGTGTIYGKNYGPITINENYLGPNGMSYRGSQNKNILGNTCINWDSLDTSDDWYPTKHIGSGFESNYCRNYQTNHPSPLCFHNTAREWAYCEPLIKESYVIESNLNPDTKYFYVKTNDVIDSTSIFYLYVSNNHQNSQFMSPFISHSSVVSAEITWVVICGELSTEIIETYSSPDHSDLQTVEHNIVGITQFTLPIISSSKPECFIDKVEIIQTISGWQTSEIDPRFETLTFVDATDLNLIPIDLEDHFDYDFYIRATLKGGYSKVFLNKKTLRVGCSTSLILTQSETQQTTYLKLGQQVENIYEMVHPQTDRPWCVVIDQSMIDLKLDNQLNSTVLQKSILCLDPSQCGQFDIFTTTPLVDLTKYYLYSPSKPVFEITFKIKQIVTGGKFIISPLISIYVQCHIDTNTLEFQTYKKSQKWFKDDAKNNQYIFQPMKCTFQYCCRQINYIATSTQNSLEQHSLMGTYKTKEFTGEIIFQVQTDQVVKYSEFYIYAKNDLGQELFSEKISIEIEMDCRKDLFIYNSTMPEISELAMQSLNGVPVIKLKYMQNETVSFKYDFSNRFIYECNCPLWCCPITNYKIDKVLMGTSFTKIPENIYKTLFEIDEKGIFQIKNSTYPYRDYKVYLSVYNGKIWSQSNDILKKHLLDITINALPEIPQFKEALPTKRVEISFGPKDKKMEYIIPEKGNTVTEVNPIGIPQFMKYDPLSNKIEIFRCDKVDLNGQYTLNGLIEGGNYDINFKLFDSQGKFTESVMQFYINKQPDCPPPPRLVSKPKSWVISLSDPENQNFQLYTIPDSKYPATTKIILQNVPNYIDQESYPILKINRKKMIKFSKEYIEKDLNFAIQVIQQTNLGDTQTDLIFVEIVPSIDMRGNQKNNELTKIKDLYDQTLNVTAKISQINCFGEVSITFNATMNNKIIQRKLSEVVEVQENQIVPYDAFEIYIEPCETKLEDPDFDVEQYGLTWNVTSFEPKELIIKINFTNPIQISSLIEPDILVVKIISLDWLFSPEVNKTIHQSSKILTKPIRKQIDDNEQNRSKTDNAKSANTGMIALLVGALIMNIFMSGSMFYFISMIRSLQILLHLPMFNINTPAIVSTVFQIIIPVAMFDVLELFEEYDFFNSFKDMIFGNIDQQQQHEYEQKWQKTIQLGYENQNAISNLGSLAYVTLFIYIKIFLYLVSVAQQKIQKKKAKNRFNIYFENNFHLGDLLEIFVEGYLEFLIAGFFNFKYGSFSTSSDSISVIFGTLTCYFALIMMPIVFFMFMKKTDQELEQQVNIKRFEPFYKDLRYENSRIRRIFILLFMLRRIIFVFLIFNLDETVSFQIMPLFYSNLFMTIYQGYSNPLNRKMKNNVELFNEFCVSIASYHIVVLTEWEPNPANQESAGNSMIFIMVVMIAVDLYFVFYTLIVQFCFLVLKYYRKIKFYLNYKFDEQFRHLHQMKLQMRKVKIGADLIEQENQTVPQPDDNETKSVLQLRQITYANSYSGHKIDMLMKKCEKSNLLLSLPQINEEPDESLETPRFNGSDGKRTLFGINPTVYLNMNRQDQLGHIEQINHYKDLHKMEQQLISQINQFSQSPKQKKRIPLPRFGNNDYKQSNLKLVKKIQNEQKISNSTTGLTNTLKEEAIKAGVQNI